MERCKLCSIVLTEEEEIVALFLPELGGLCYDCQRDEELNFSQDNIIMDNRNHYDEEE